jgi:hypothetical protein
LCTAIADAGAEKAAAVDGAAASGGAARSVQSSAEGSMPGHSGGAAAAAPAVAGQQEAAAGRKAELLYSDGCTLAVSGAAQPLLLSGSMCNPPRRPLGEGRQGSGSCRGPAKRHSRSTALGRRFCTWMVPVHMYVEATKAISFQLVRRPPSVTCLRRTLRCSGGLAWRARRQGGGVWHRGGVFRGGPAATRQCRCMRPAARVAAPGAHGPGVQHVIHIIYPECRALYTLHVFTEV